MIELIDVNFSPELGLEFYYNSNSDFAMLCKLFLAMAFAPEIEIPALFDVIGKKHTL